ncbi:uncharacterized protein L203_100064 [Cryptococcus depauperatus CBS 7841]|uniref:Uncharacterized protein n=1 Tax=Cryptococcus depauperatus CBS 7841 TaxID=1295531 RepID=A0AAJ8LX27_9TREE
MPSSEPPSICLCKFKLYKSIKESGEETQLVDGPANVNPGLDTAHSNPCNLSVDALSALLAITTTFETYTYTVYDPVTISQVSYSAQIVESTSTLATDSQMAGESKQGEATFSSTSDSGNGSCTDKPNPTGDLLPFSSSQSAIDAIALPTNDSPSSVAGAANGSPAVAASEPSLDSSDNGTVERSGPQLFRSQSLFQHSRRVHECEQWNSYISPDATATVTKYEIDVETVYITSWTTVDNTLTRYSSHPTQAASSTASPDASKDIIFSVLTGGTDVNEKSTKALSTAH